MGGAEPKGERGWASKESRYDGGGVLEGGEGRTIFVSITPAVQKSDTREIPGPGPDRHKNFVSCQKAGHFCPDFLLTII